MSASRGPRRRRTRLWFIFYTALLLAIGVVCIVTRQWSAAATTLAVAAVFMLVTRSLRRRS